MAKMRIDYQLGATISDTLFDAFIVTFSFLIATNVVNLINYWIAGFLTPEQFPFYCLLYYMFPDSLSYIVSDLINTYTRPETLYIYLISTGISIGITILVVVLKYKSVKRREKLIKLMREKKE